MPRSPNYFINPSDGQTYAWLINHDEEDPSDKKRGISHSAPTNKVGLNKQQGDASPLILRYKGKILKQSQVVTMICWYATCDYQTIYFQDFEGNKYEVIITDLQMSRQRVAKNPQDLVHMRTHIYLYTIEMEVLQIISGVWLGTAV